jgi:hypothetical protein
MWQELTRGAPIAKHCDKLPAVVWATRYAPGSGMYIIIASWDAYTDRIRETLTAAKPDQPCPSDGSLNFRRAVPRPTTSRSTIGEFR